MITWVSAEEFLAQTFDLIEPLRILRLYCGSFWFLAISLKAVWRPLGGKRLLELVDSQMEILHLRFGE